MVWSSSPLTSNRTAGPGLMVKTWDPLTTAPDRSVTCTLKRYSPAFLSRKVRRKAVTVGVELASGVVSHVTRDTMPPGLRSQQTCFAMRDAGRWTEYATFTLK